jgi:hypothetical protein
VEDETGESRRKKGEKVDDKKTVRIQGNGTNRRRDLDERKERKT